MGGGDEWKQGIGMEINDVSCMTMRQEGACIVRGILQIHKLIENKNSRGGDYQWFDLAKATFLA